MAQKQVRVRYRRTMGIGAAKRGPGYETDMDAGHAAIWAQNGRIEIIASGKEKARPKAGDADPMKAPPSGSPAGLGAVSSSSRRGRPPKTLKSGPSVTVSPPKGDPFPFG